MPRRASSRVSHPVHPRLPFFQFTEPALDEGLRLGVAVAAALVPDPSSASFCRKRRLRASQAHGRRARLTCAQQFAVLLERAVERDVRPGRARGPASRPAHARSRSRAHPKRGGQALQRPDGGAVLANQQRVAVEVSSDGAGPRCKEAADSIRCPLRNAPPH